MVETSRKKGRKTLTEEDLFESMGRVYKLLVNEKTRRLKEEPLLLETAEKARQQNNRKKPKSSTRVLDLACGTGFHTRLFARSGYHATGIDRSEAMLTEARKFRSKGKLIYQTGDLLEPLKIRYPASLTLLLGNTLSTFAKFPDIGKIFKHASDATRRGGYLLCQTLNYDHLKHSGGKTVTRHSTVDNRETILTKGLHLVEDGTVLITMSVSQKDFDNSWKSACKTAVLNPLTPKHLTTQAGKAGFKNENIWGDLTKSPYVQSKSTDCVVLFRKI